MFFDLNIPVPDSGFKPTQTSKKNKGKQPQTAPSAPAHSPAQIRAVETRVDLLIHLGYNVIAFSQTVYSKLDQKTHANVLDSLVSQLAKRPGIVFLKRLNIILDADSEKGFGLTNANLSLVEPYDLISLTPTTASTFSLACLTHSLPSALTAHVISLPLTAPRLPFHLKHTLVRTAIKNGAVFEINYAGALGSDGDGSSSADASGASSKRNWWAAAREIVRVTKGKGLIVSGGVVDDADFRAPRDVANLVALLGLAQNVAHDCSTTSPKSLVLRAGTRRTYRAVFSEPTVVIPGQTTQGDLASAETSAPGTVPDPAQAPSTPVAPSAATLTLPQKPSKKRTRDEDQPNQISSKPGVDAPQTDGEGARKKKKGKNKEKV
ncbi:PHP domain-like protein [Coniophora puteana RWD-64-598 SS2]|uniref:PHP domain-like protein n=1 Tax=Coniophora puteana (strain RWD-64-598) TaxID=741705 RepID=A0A5M3MHK4_CONPW|nr:PHP domain-like protein [Coniophora puteana RWD-64-598 SS2]EIW78115.1 PHP domain-like protein [Coniophora puteana RWD-64-598 SS2]